MNQVGRALTERQREILQLLKHEVRTKGYPPSVREIGQAIGLQSSSTVHGHLMRLEEKGYIRRDPTKPRAIEILGEGEGASRKAIINVPLLGVVAAGAPILATQQAEDVYPLPAGWLKGSEQDVFMLEVHGDSMIEGGILHGDYVIVRRQQQADNGEIVVALVDDSATVKKFYKEAGQVRLQPENRFMDPMFFPSVEILGKVIGLIRREVQ